MADRATVTFHTTPELKSRLELASLRRRSKSFLTNEAVERYFADEEAFVAAVEEGLAQAEAGEVIDQPRAGAYLRSLGTSRIKPVPKPPRA